MISLYVANVAAFAGPTCTCTQHFINTCTNGNIKNVGKTRALKASRTLSGPLTSLFGTRNIMDDTTATHDKSVPARDITNIAKGSITKTIFTLIAPIVSYPTLVQAIVDETTGTDIDINALEIAELPPVWVPIVFAVLILGGVGLLTSSLGDVYTEGEVFCALYMNI